MLHSPPRTEIRVLVVEPAATLRAALRAAMIGLARVESQSQFATARARLGVATFDVLVTNIRLEAYNGLHLVYLAGAIAEGPRAIVYGDIEDLRLAREAQQIGAFYVRRGLVAFALGSYLQAYLSATLPDRDRRDAAVRDRRGTFRTGRRSEDRYLG